MADTRWLRIPPETEVESRTTWTIAVNENQYLLGASVILLNRPCGSVRALTVAEWMDLHTQMRRVQKAIDDVLAPDQYDFAFFTNLAHQVVLDVIPRYQDTRRWAGQRFDDERWGEAVTPGERRLHPEALRDLRDAIRAHLPAVV